MRELSLWNNPIRVEEKHLANISNLKKLRLWKNQIEDLKGLGTLINLEELDLGANPINETERSLIGKSAQEIVKYCQEKARKAQK